MTLLENIRPSSDHIKFQCDSKLMMLIGVSHAIHESKSKNANRNYYCAN